MIKFFSFLVLLLFLVGCAPQEHTVIPRTSVIPSDAVKMSPDSDLHPPMLHSDEFEQPVPLAVTGSAGAEDSPFIPDDGSALYFFFTPDVRIPAEKQVIDGVTGIYVSKRVDGEYKEPERVFLQDAGKLALDGCGFVQDDTIWFCSVREGYTGIHWFTARLDAGKWTDWKISDFNPDYEVGELHISGDELYFHSSRDGGKGGYDIWVSQRVGDGWQEPVDVAVVNSADTDGWPYVSQDGSELWFTRTYLGTPAVYRSKNVDDAWQEPELIVSQFAGEPTLDPEGNLYFVHHYYNDSVMIEADIYVAYKKS